MNIKKRLFSSTTHQVLTDEGIPRRKAGNRLGLRQRLARKFGKHLNLNEIKASIKTYGQETV